MKKILGFTLAEVLITLGVIGVVAALTMPSLIANYQKKVWVNQLKKSYSVISQALNKIAADEDVDNFSNTHLYNLIAGTTTSYGEHGGPPIVTSNSDGNEEEITNIFKQYFNTVNVCPIGQTDCIPDSMKNYLKLNGTVSSGGPMNPNGSYEQQHGIYLFMSDGSVYIFKDTMVFVDVNGPKGPNKWGRDAFLFTSTGGYGIYNNKFGPWIDGSERCSSGHECDCGDKSYGWECAAKIINDGWNMDY